MSDYLNFLTLQIDSYQVKITQYVHDESFLIQVYQYLASQLPVNWKLTLMERLIQSKTILANETYDGMKVYLDKLKTESRYGLKLTQSFSGAITGEIQSDAEGQSLMCLALVFQLDREDWTDQIFYQQLLFPLLNQLTPVSWPIIFQVQMLLDRLNLSSSPCLSTPSCQLLLTSNYFTLDFDAQLPTQINSLYQWIQQELPTAYFHYLQREIRCFLKADDLTLTQHIFEIWNTYAPYASARHYQLFKYRSWQSSYSNDLIGLMMLGLSLLTVRSRAPEIESCFNQIFCQPELSLKDALL